MSSTVKKLSAVQAQIDVSVPREEVVSTTARMLQRVSREARIPGFRKGKAPMATLRRMFGTAVMGEVREDLVSRHLIEAFREHELMPISEPDFKAGEVSESEDFTFSVTIEVAPHLDRIITEGVTVEKYRLKLDPALTDRELARLQSNMATIRDFESPRPIATGDMVKLSLRREADGSPADEAMPPQDFVLEADRAPREMIDALIGKNVDDSVSMELGVGTPRAIRFHCTVLEHKERVLPALDNEFAKDLGEFETIEDLRADIDKRRMAHLEEQENERLRHGLLEALRDKNPMEMPPSILRRQAQAMKSRFDNMIDKIKTDAGLDSEGNPADVGDEIDESTLKAAHDVIHMHFLIEEIARQEQLAVTDADLDAEFKKMSESTGLPIPRIKAEYAKGGRMADFKGLVLERKVFDFMSPKVTIVEVDPPSTVQESAE